MKLTIFFDHRFYDIGEGRIVSKKTYNYDFFSSRYLTVFDHVSIVARVAEGEESLSSSAFTEGPGVSVAPVGNWKGVRGYLANRRKIEKCIDEQIGESEAAILIAPGTIASTAAKRMIKTGRPFGVEVVGDPHDAFSKGASKHPLRPFLQKTRSDALRRLCANASAVTYVTANALQTRYPADREAFSTFASDVVLPESNDISKLQNCTSRNTSMNCIFVGTLETMYKAPDILLKAFAIVAEVEPTATLTLVGDGNFRESLEDLAVDLSIQNSVEFRGHVNSGAPIVECLDSADLFILPSYQEGLPRAMIEAMSRGIPCIGTNVGGIPELLEPDEMVQPGDHIALASKILEVLQDPHRQSEMSTRNIAKSEDYRSDVLGQRRLAFQEYLRSSTEKWKNGQLQK